MLIKIQALLVFKPDQKWRAQITINTGKKIHIGDLVDEIDAALAYNDKALLLFGEFAKLNDIV